MFLFAWDQPGFEPAFFVQVHPGLDNKHSCEKFRLWNHVDSVNILTLILPSGETLGNTLSLRSIISKTC